mgnify:CR=1 FL=1
MPIGNRNWKSAGALTALVLMLFTTVSVPEMTVNAGNSYAASESAAETADERKNETSLTNELYARAAVLMDAENGRILFSKNGDEVLPMASTTKIMTCVLALETGNPEASCRFLLMRRGSRRYIWACRRASITEWRISFTG